MYKSRRLGGKCHTGVGFAHRGGGRGKALSYILRKNGTICSVLSKQTSV